MTSLPHSCPPSVWKWCATQGDWFTAKRVAKELGLPASTMVRTLEALVYCGHLERNVSKWDGNENRGPVEYKRVTRMRLPMVVPQETLDRVLSLLRGEPHSVGSVAKVLGVPEGTAEYGVLFWFEKGDVWRMNDGKYCG